MSRPKRGAPQVLLAGCLGAAAIAACGSGATPTTRTTTTAKIKAAPGPSLVANETATQILRQSAAALRVVGSFEMQGTMTQLKPRKRISFRLTIYTSRQFEMTATETVGGFSAIVDGKHAYLRANAKFWTNASHGATSASLFANHWFVFPEKNARSLEHGLGHLAPSAVAKCMLRDIGRVRVAGHTTVGGQQAVLIHAAPNRPGEQASTIAIAAHGAPYPLRVSGGGKPLPGHSTGGPCGGSGQANDGRVTLSHFGTLGKLHVPKHAPTVLEFARHAAAVHLA